MLHPRDTLTTAVCIPQQQCHAEWLAAKATPVRWLNARDPTWPDTHMGGVVPSIHRHRSHAVPLRLSGFLIPSSNEDPNSFHGSTYPPIPPPSRLLAVPSTDCARAGEQLPKRHRGSPARVHVNHSRAAAQGGDGGGMMEGHLIPNQRALSLSFFKWSFGLPP